MFFIVSKLFWLVVQPLSLSVLLGAAGLVLVGAGRRRLGLWAGGTGLLVLVVACFTSLGMVLLAPLENRFERPAALPGEVASIIMLGGATNGRVSISRGVSELGEAGDRVVETLRLAQLYPEAQIVLTGGSGLLGGETQSEASIGGRLLEALGVAPERLVLEEASRNTGENAALTAALLGPADGTVVLVTSAFHMPRSVGLFREAGLVVTPWPVDYRSTGSETFGLDITDPVGNMVTLGVAMREWIGLLVYAGTGRIATPFPAP